MAEQQYHFTPLTDSQVPLEYQGILEKYRRMSAEQAIASSASLCCRIQVADFTLKNDAPKLGPCREKFWYLQPWQFLDVLTMDALVFWLPQLVLNSVAKTRAEHLSMLADMRERFDLPSHHMAGFGQASLVAGLLLMHYKATSERLPSNGLYVRTDTVFIAKRCLGLGGFHEQGLHCAGWFWDEWKFDGLGVLALGIEPLNIRT